MYRPTGAGVGHDASVADRPASRPRYVGHRHDLQDELDVYGRDRTIVSGKAVVYHRSSACIRIYGNRPIHLQFYAQRPPAPAFWLFVFDCLALAAVVLFGAIVWRMGRGFFFGLRRRPIRFHRGELKLYAIRSRRFLMRRGQGDVVWEAPWTKDSIFCLHKEVTQFNTVYHIRHYTVNESGNVTRAFSIGREWTGSPEVELVLVQWNYWCKYMNSGPNGLPKPMLFHTEHETPRESFLFALYGLGMRASPFWRIITMPLVLVFAAGRIVANASCRDPEWPESIEKVSEISPDDPYAEPRAGTPVGWAETVLAQQRGEYPNDPQGKVDHWRGEQDGVVNARLWLTDRPPKNLSGA